MNAGRRRPVSLILVIVAVGAVFMLWSANVTAQEILAVRACAADAKSLCSGISGTGLEPVRGCFRDHIKEVSGVCLLSMAKLLEAEEDPGCRAHIDRQCANVKIGEGRLEACLRGAVDTLSASCKDVIVRAVAGAR
jgi:hypothetical protein